MSASVRIEDHAIWFKHIDEDGLRKRLAEMRDDEQINLIADGVSGRWRRMRTGKDGRRTEAIRPEGEMKAIWNDWFRARKGERIVLNEARLADDYLEAGSQLFSEWLSPEDEEAFRDL